MSNSATLYIEQGASFKYEITGFTDADWGSDLSTGYTAKLQARAGYAYEYPGTPLISLTDGTGIDLGDGTITVTIDADDTAALDPADFPAYYDLEITKTATGEVRRIIEGRVKLEPEVTI